MNWLHYACNRCNQTIRTPIDNPDNHIACARCGYMLFHEISKEEYAKARSGK
jgi:DNA-directed RNA polymerase subunit RPC12/RpoP